MDTDRAGPSRREAAFTDDEGRHPRKQRTCRRSGAIRGTPAAGRGSAAEKTGRNCNRRAHLCDQIGRRASRRGRCSWPLPVWRRAATVDRNGLHGAGQGRRRGRSRPIRAHWCERCAVGRRCCAPRRGGGARRERRRWSPQGGGCALAGHSDFEAKAEAKSARRCARGYSRPKGGGGQRCARGGSRRRCRRRRRGAAARRPRCGCRHHLRGR